MAKLLKVQSLRNNEYYNMQSVFDELYTLSKKNSKFKKLISFIIDERNILLAYRNIKNNQGSMTYGVDKQNIIDIANKDIKKFTNIIQGKILDYKPRPIKRVYIEKKNGKLRPLGIPCMIDRIVQQCIKQVIEPILEAKFYNHSYGFRPDRGCKYAIARCNFLINQSSYYYCVDFDIKSFFDNVNHGKLLKQLWNLGIQDKNLLKIISKMLKCEIANEGIPSKGTPQGGILSPLLANVVLNELDWWVASQWDNVKTTKDYCCLGNKQRALKKSSKLKEMYIVRYADDFKIFCKSRNHAKKILIATKNWLKERLDLDISMEKTKITNLRKNYSEFLGIEFKAVKKRNNYVSRSKMTKSSIQKCKTNLRKQINRINKFRNTKEVTLYNSIILGIQNYYNMATKISLDLNRIDYDLRKLLYNKLRRYTKIQRINQCHTRLYKGYTGKTYVLNGMPLYPLYACKNKHTMNMNQNITRYSKEGREIIHSQLECVSPNILNYILKNPVQNTSVEFNDNRLSLYVAQKGKCYISNKPLKIKDMHCHHKKPRFKGGDDKYNNLVLLNTDMHKLVHMTDKVKIEELMKQYSWDLARKEKLNKLRKLANNFEI